MRSLARIFCAAVFAASALSASASDVAVVAHDPGYYTSLAKHVVRWLKTEGVEADLETPATMAKAFAGAKIAFLVGFDSPSGPELDAISAYRARGGRLVVFYSSSPRLASLMGVKVIGFAKAPSPGRWSRMDFSAKYLDGCPASILQTSSVLQRAEPLPGKGRVMATWSDRSGRPTGDAAWIATSAGYWMTHVLLADGDESLKAQLLAAMAASASPRLWNARAAAERKAREAASVREFAARQQPRPGEIRAVWEHSGCGLYPGDWPRTIRLLKENGITDLFLNVAGAGFAHYASSVLPQSAVFRQEGDQLAAALAAARGSGIRVHAWILCFTGTRSTPDRLETFRRRGWRLKSRDGALTEYLDPSNAAVRQLILDAIDEIQDKYPVAGIHLDFVRWYERAAKPKDASDVITRFVASARLHVRRPRWLTAAVLGKYPACVDSVGQDWTGWLGANLVDCVVPMDYTSDDAQFEGFLRQHSLLKTHARKTIAGIGVTANESRLDARQVISQILLARKYGLGGVALFDLDTTLEKNILPYLKLGVFR